MRLLRVELTRFGCRRAIALIGLVTVGLTALLVASAAWSTRPVDSTERAVAQEQLARQVELAEADYQACLADPATVYGPGATAADCELVRPSLDWFLPRPTLDLAAELDGRGMTVMLLLVGAAIAAAATFAGADWGSGSMSNQLLFVPRRLRVWSAKAVAAVVGTTLFSTAVLAGFWGALAGFAAARGRSAPAEAWTAILETSVRGVGLVAAVALGSLALTMLLRHTVGTLGLLFGYAVVGEALAASLPFERMSQWSMAHNLSAWLQDGARVYDESICGDQPGACEPWYELSLEHAVTYLGVLLVLAVVASTVSFARRDIA
jgi:ABC-2 type transport system permease protein